MRALPVYTFLLATTLAYSAVAEEVNRYINQPLVANRAQYKPSFVVDKQMINAWGIATRPAGAGGHFWVVAGDISFEYVGDVQRSADVHLRTLHTDALAYVKLPVGGKDQFGTGVVFVDSKNDFVITQKIEGAEPITAPAKFLFASDGGIISAWTERKKEDGTFDRPADAVTVVDASKEGVQFFGLAISAAYDRLYAADFGDQPGIRLFDGAFKPLPVEFDMPFDDNKNGKVDAGEYAPFNVQTLNGNVFVAYAKTQTCPKEEIKNGACKKGEIFAGEEDTSKPGYGRLAEFDEDGKLIAVWNDGEKLSAPWGLAFAPADFGVLSGTLLVANFGDGTIAAYDRKSRDFVDVLRDAQGKPIVIDKIWGLIFGNGASLGDSNALYYSAGPRDEKDGVFGSLRVMP